jgi:hypothetical protein
MKVKLVVAIIERSLVEHTPRIVPEYELTLLEAVHKSAIIDHEATDALKGQTKDIESVEAEYINLCKVYGDDEKTGMPLVERIYGSEHNFSNAVAQYLADGEQLEELEPKQKRKTTVKKAITE